MKDFHCDECRTHWALHRGGRNLPCDWCETHSRQVPMFGSGTKAN